VGRRGQRDPRVRHGKADFVKTLSDEAIARHVEHGSRIPSMHLYQIDGAAHRVGDTETAFSCRDSTWAEVIVGVDPDPANNEKTIAWTKAHREALHPYGAGA